jgi:adenosylcobinamide-phosphate guanylyltransferase
MGAFGLKAVIMAGGKASRLGGNREKALLEVGGRSLLSRAADALRVDGIDEIVVAVTKATTRSKALAENLGLSVLQTGAEGYHEDTLELLDSFGSFISLNVDIPFIRPEHVRKMLEASDKESLAAVIPSSIAMREPDKDSVGDDGTGRNVIWIGLNFVTPNSETSHLTYDDPLLSININTDEDLAFARKLIGKIEKGAAPSSE